jgi:urea transport system substrate-binding protein
MVNEMKRSLNRGIINLTLIAGMAAVLVYFVWLSFSYLRTKPNIKIGVLHSLTGTMAASEAPLVDAVRLVVEEANQTGGINGVQIEIVTTDCHSDADYCAQQAEKLISQAGVQALFGCWTSSCRQAVKKVVEKHHHLLFYPLQYEGLEHSPNIIYTGAAPNQQIIPMVGWAMQQRGKRVYLLGSDYFFPRTANQIIKKLLQAQEGQLLAERYVPLGERNMDAIVREIVTQHPDFVLNTLNGETNQHFFRALRQAGVRADDIPVFSTSIAEVELAAMGPELMAGHYAAWNYFQSVQSESNRVFIEHFRHRFGSARVLDDPIEAAYIAVNLWVNAARNSGTLDIPAIKKQLELNSFSAPEGIVAVDADNGHLWKTVRIGRARADGQFDLVWQSTSLVRPAPSPFFIRAAELTAIAGQSP